MDTLLSPLLLLFQSSWQLKSRIWSEGHFLSPNVGSSCTDLCGSLSRKFWTTEQCLQCHCGTYLNHFEPLPREHTRLIHWRWQSNTGETYMSSRQTHAQTSIGQCMRRLHGKNALFFVERFAPRLGGLEKIGNYMAYKMAVWYIRKAWSQFQTRDLLESFVWHCDIEHLGQEES